MRCGLCLGRSTPLGKQHDPAVGTLCLYNKDVEDGFDWDKKSKAEINFRRHGVRMAEATAVFYDPYSITLTDNESDPTEQRFATVGIGGKGRLLVVVYTYRDEHIRIISARPAEPHERKEYEEQR